MPAFFVGGQSPPKRFYTLPTVLLNLTSSLPQSQGINPGLKEAIECRRDKNMIPPSLPLIRGGVKQLPSLPRRG